MKYIMMVWCAILTISAIAQDKKADKILDKLSQEYSNIGSLSIDFDLIIEYPEQDKISLPSSVIQSGDKWVFSNTEQVLYNNGSDIWMFIPSKNEVEINDLDEEAAEDFFVSPLGILNEYKSGKYKYQIADKDRTLTHIEFIPKDEFSDYSKFKVAINTSQNVIKEIRAFGKDGSKATLIIIDIKKDISVTDETFQFDKAKYPGVRVEDLRLD